MFITKRLLLCNEAPAAEAGTGGGGGAPTGEPPPVAAATATSAAQPTGDQPSSVLATGATAQPPADPLSWIPEKHRVTKEDGAVDIEASSRKVAEAYSNLEKRLGSGDAPPKTPDEYAPKLDIEGFDFEAVKADPKTQGFLKGAHAKGLTNEQVSYVLNEYYKTVPELVTAAASMNMEQGEQALRQVWKTEDQYKENVGGAFRAFNAYAQKAGVTMQEFEASGAANNPTVMRLLAAIAPELGEDRAVQVDGDPGAGETIEKLMMSEAYSNERHPDYKSVNEKVRRYYEAKHGKAPAA